MVKTAVAAFLVVTSAAPAAAEQITNDFILEFSFTAKHVMPYLGDCTGSALAGVTVRDTAQVAVADVECPATFGVVDKGKQLMIVLPGQTARSVPFDFALDKPYRVKVSVTGDNIQVAIPEGADLAWENAPLKANPTEYPMTFTSRLAVEITGFKVTQLGTLPPKPPADGQPPADQTRPVPNEKK